MSDIPKQEEKEQVLQVLGNIKGGVLTPLEAFVKIDQIYSELHIKKTDAILEQIKKEAEL